MAKHTFPRKVPDDLRTLIVHQVRLREQLVAWHHIAALAGVSCRAVLKIAAEARKRG
jgi:hypothetical protein